MPENMRVFLMMFGGVLCGLGLADLLFSSSPLLPKSVSVLVILSGIATSYIAANKFSN